MSDTERRKEQKVMDRAEERRRGQDALRTNPEVMERHDPGAERSNPEVMGRSEPQAMTESRQREMSPEMSNVRMRFDQLQSEFIDDPKGAVKKARQLMDEMFEKMQERLRRTHKDAENTDDTEKLRLAMKSYRDMLDPSGGRRTY